MSGLDQVRSELKGLVEDVDMSYLKIGKLLCKVSAGAMWAQWGYPNFPMYLEKELAFKYRKARYLISVWKTFIDEYGMAETDLHGIPYSKLAMILPVVNGTNLTHWINIARTGTVAEVKEAVTKALKGSGAEAAKPWTVLVFTEQRENIDAAVAAASEAAKTESRGHALDMMATEFLSSRTGGDTSKQSLQRIMRNIERAFGTTLVSFDSKETMQAWAKHIASEGTK